MISEQHVWTYRDSFYRFVLTPDNYIPGFMLGVLYAVGVIYFAGMSSNPLFSFAVQVIFIMVLYVLGCLVWEFFQYMRMSTEEKTLHWEIDAKSLKRTDGTGEESVFKWNRIQRVKTIMSGYMLHRSSGAPIWLPIKLFTPDQAERFEEIFTDGD